MSIASLFLIHYFSQSTYSFRILSSNIIHLNEIELSAIDIAQHYDYAGYGHMP